jgi:hypothetical protein
MFPYEGPLLQTIRCLVTVREGMTLYGLTKAAGTPLPLWLTHKEWRKHSCPSQLFLIQFLALTYETLTTACYAHTVSPVRPCGPAAYLSADDKEANGRRYAVPTAMRAYWFDNRLPQRVMLLLLCLSSKLARQRSRPLLGILNGMMAGAPRCGALVLSWETGPQEPLSAADKMGKRYVHRSPAFPARWPRFHG